MNRARCFIHRQFYGESRDGEGMSALNRLVLSVVLASIVFAVVETEQALVARAPTLFTAVNLAFALLFTAEYGARLWAVGVDPRFRGVAGRLRYAGAPVSLIDLAVVASMWLSLLVTAVGPYWALLRIVRILRVLSLARHSRWGIALNLFAAALRQRSRELALSGGLAVMIVIVSATVLYAVERAAQPEYFGSIPRAMWWAIATLTTVGYGDVYPVTVLGKLCASVTALAAIGIVAMTAGIMAAAFGDTFGALRERTARR